MTNKQTKKQSKNLGTEASEETKSGLSNRKIREEKELKMSLVMELIEYPLASKWQSPVIHSKSDTF